MKLEKQLLIIALLALLLAIPVAFALQHRGHEIKLQKSINSALQVKLDTKQKEVDHSAQQLQQQQNSNADLQKQLQSKRDEAAKIAAAQAPTAPVVVSGAGNCDAYRGLLAAYDWNVNTAAAVMRAESGCNPVAVSATCDHGLMQINCVHIAKVGGDLSLLNDPATNIRVAYAVYAAAGGWTPWTTYTSGAYLRYL